MAQTLEASANHDFEAHSRLVDKLVAIPTGGKEFNDALELVYQTYDMLSESDKKRVVEKKGNELSLAEKVGIAMNEILESYRMKRGAYLSNITPRTPRFLATLIGLNEAEWKEYDSFLHERERFRKLHPIKLSYI